MLSSGRREKCGKYVPYHLELLYELFSVDHLWVEDFDGHLLSTVFAVVHSCRCALAHLILLLAQGWSAKGQPS
jgi:hypothetical protein